MKKIKKSTHLRRNLIIIAAVLVLAVGTGSFAAYTNKWWPFIYTSNTTTPSEFDNDQKKSTVENTSIPTTNDPNPSSKNSGTGGGGSTPYTPPTSSNNISIEPSKTDSSTVVVITKLAGYSDGQCSLKVSNGDRTNTQSARVMYQPQYATCAGFTVPISSLGTGLWRIELTVTSGDSTVKKQMSFEVQ